MEQRIGAKAPTRAKTHWANFKSSRRRFATAGVLLLAAGILMLAFGTLGDAPFPAYRVFSRTVMAGIASATGLVPVAVWDILAIALAAAIAASLAYCAVCSKSLWRWLSTICVIVAALLLFLVAAWGLNHYAPPLSRDLNLQVDEYSADELYDATSHYLDVAASLATEVERDDDQRMVPQDFSKLARIAGKSYGGLEGAYPVFEGSDAPVKLLAIAGEPLLYSGHTGIFWPFTAEASVPANCAPASMPFIMCHEAAHRLGIASEQEANFAAYLACEANSDPRFRYSGTCEAFAYCYNALAGHYPDRAGELKITAFDRGLHDDSYNLGVRLVFADWKATSAHYAAYEGPAADAGRAGNDAYLKLFSEESGVKSYGEVVDYLIAWYKKETD